MTYHDSLWKDAPEGSVAWAIRNRDDSQVWFRLDKDNFLTYNLWMISWQKCRGMRLTRRRWKTLSMTSL